jgi:hypothetical protein
MCKRKLHISGFTFLHQLSGSSSVGRATAFQAVGRGFEPRLPLINKLGGGKLGLFVCQEMCFRPGTCVPGRKLKCYQQGSLQALKIR